MVRVGVGDRMMVVEGHPDLQLNLSKRQHSIFAQCAQLTSPSKGDITLHNIPVNSALLCL